MRMFPNTVMYFDVLLSKFHDEIVKGLTSLESHQLKAAVEISFPFNVFFSKNNIFITI